MRLFKTTYRDERAGAKGKRPRRQSRTWTVEIIDHRKVVRRFGGHANKADARHWGVMADALVEHRKRGQQPGDAVAKWIEGLTPRHLDRLAAHGLLDRQEGFTWCPLAEQVGEFHDHLRAKGDTKAQAAQVVGRVRRVFEACGFRRWTDVRAHAVEQRLMVLRDGPKGLSHRTSNFYLAAIKHFCGWMVVNERATASPVAHLDRVKVVEGQRRRALGDDELVRLIAVAEHDPKKVQGVLGPDRALLYRLALGTGFRANELRSLTRASFDLGADPPTVTVEAAYSKHRERDVQPIDPELAERMRPHLAVKVAGERILRVPNRTAAMLRADLRLARARWIRQVPDRAGRRDRRRSSFLAVRDENNHVVDFHALRHTFITRLARAGVAPAAAKTLARHKTIALTMDYYTHMLVEDSAAALARLPAITPEAEGREARAAGASA